MEKYDTIATLAALAQETRLDIFRLLVEVGPEGRAVGRIGEALGLPSATLSFHLKELKHAGLVSVQREGRSLIYAANFATMTGLIDYLTRHCCAGDPAACGITPPTNSARKETA
ncbi:ArsR/SmtB family transcription factor [Pontibaca methylaminivorans]|uniref:Transcriptional regulator, ArsR family n=1 Tax=Pontibaca methylaminivorans TaxID=515897 RepID=A0A1R3W7E9_9RHOB|nr:metalloregulator ArsR/SmtB family transcription factor [Pontibaca methylaminivorans]SIT73641.1 transcriptional regulator, ArsR family [Pontibaca methylaminivorans]